MNRFVFKVPQIAVVITALAMSVLTLGVAIAPAQLEASAPPAYATVRDSAAIEVDIIPARIDVVAQREPQTLLGAVKQIFGRRGQPT
jgi:hypothetical protein